MLPTLEQVRQYVVTVIIPPIAGIAATWLTVHAHFLATFHITTGSVAGEITQVLIWAVTTGVAWLGTHNILKGIYTPAAKAALGKGVNS